MSAQNSGFKRYTGTTMAIHWLSAILVLAAFATGLDGPARVIFSDTSLFDRQLHETLGLTVVGLSVVRMVWRLIDRRHTPHLPMPGWMHKVSKATQGALYLLLIAVPVTGLITVGMGGHGVDLLGGLHLVPPAPLNEPLSHQLGDIHKWLGDAILWVAGVHAAAALFHHYILRDGVLSSMLPARVSARLPGPKPVA